MKKTKRILRNVLLILVILLILIFAVTKISGNHRSDPADVITYETSNPFITGKTELIAHRLGAGIAPEESLLAIQTCLENPGISMDIYEFDLRLTADNRLVLIHDATLDDTTNASSVFGEEGILVLDKTLEELRTLNTGANFTDADGNQPYADYTELPIELRILTLEEALDTLTQSGANRFSIEVKDGGEPGMKAVDLLYKELSDRNLLGSVIFSSFKTDVSAYAAETYPNLLRSNTDAQAIEFYLAAITGDDDYIPPCSVFQFPFNDKYLNMGINFGTAQIINFAHSKNVAVHYWVVDDPDRMEYLQSIGADGIMSDYPNLLTETLLK